MRYCPSLASLLFFQRANPRTYIRDRFFVSYVDVVRLSYQLSSSWVSQPFSATPFLGPLLRANSCVLQLRGLCFPGSALNSIGFPPIKHPLALEAEATRFWVAPRKWGKKKEKIRLCLTYMLSGIGLRTDSLADGCVIRACLVLSRPLPERRPATP